MTGLDPKLDVNTLERLLFDCSTCGEETEQRLIGQQPTDAPSVLLYRCERCDTRLAYRVDIVRVWRIAWTSSASRLRRHPFPLNSIT